MNVDALTLAAVADELTLELPGARIEDVFQPTPRALALQCWGGRRGGNPRTSWLLISAHPQLSRVHLLDRKPRRLVAEPPAFVMLLRKHLEGERIASIRQPRWERILEIGFRRGQSEPDAPATFWLVCEVMGRLSNVILRDDAGVILGALHTVSAAVNRYRTVAPHVAYLPPPPQTRTLRGETMPRLEPDAVTAEALAHAAEATLDAAAPADSRKAQRPTVAGLLAGHVVGFGRDAAEEATARALGSASVPLTLALDWEGVGRTSRDLAALMDTHAWQPTLVFPTADAPVPTGFAVYVPVRFADATLRPVPRVNDMLAMYFEGSEWRGAVESAKGDLRRLLQTQHDRCVRKDEVLRAELRALGEAGRLRLEADVLLAFQADVPPGASSFTIENPFPNESELAGGREEAHTLALTLDPRLSAVENANRRYERYHKLHRAGAQIPAQLEANALELARIGQLQTDLALADTLPEIALVRTEIAEAGYLRGQRPVPGKRTASDKGGKRGPVGKGGRPLARSQQGGAPLRRQSSDGCALLVGKNSRQNEDVTFHEATGGDLWLHARGVPGAHVIVKAAGRAIPETTVREAAALAAYYSQARGASTVPVDCTQQRYVRHMKGGGPGMVIYERERTLYVAPEDIGAD